MSTTSFKDNVTKTVSRNSFYTVLFHFWHLGSRLVLAPVVLSYISIEEYGLWALCFVLLSYLGFGAFGFNNTYLKYTAEHRAKNQNQKINELLSTGLIAMTLSSVIIFPLVYISTPHILKYFGMTPELFETATGLVIGSAFIFMVNFSLAGYQCALEGEQKVDLVRKIQLAASIIEMVLIIILLEKGYGVFALLWAYGIRFSFSLALSICFAYKVFSFLKIRLQFFKLEALEKFFKFGGQLQILGLMSLFINSLDRILISKFIGMDAVGFYEIGRKLPSIGQSLPTAAAGALMPTAAHLEGSSQEKKLEQMYLSGTRYLMILFTVPYVCLILFSPQIIEVWLGKGFEQAAVVMQILAVGSFINLFTGVGTSCARGMGLPKYEIKYMSLTCVSMILSAWPLVHFFGMVGGALTYTVGQIIGSIFFINWINKLFKVENSHFCDQIILPVVFIVVTSIPFFFLVESFWSQVAMVRWLGLIFLITIFLIYIIFTVIGIFLARNYLMTDEELLWISNLSFIKSFKEILRQRWKPA
jgi:O-antigen/teichoic acid export membrane protein